MKTLCCVVLLAAAGLCAPVAAFAGAVPEVYLIGGPVRSDLGADGVQFGRDLAAEMQLQLGGDWRSTKEAKFAPDFALGLRMRSERTVGGALEVRYVRRGARYALRDASGTYPVDARLSLHADYLEIPALLEFSPPSASSVRALFLVGPVLSINTKASMVAEAAGQAESVDAGPLVKGSHVDAMLGAGARVATGPNQALLVQARFSYDLGNLFSDGAGYDVRSRDLSLLVGFAFKV